MTLEQRRINAEKALKLYHDRRLSGICVACGKRPPIQGVLRCASCRKIRKAISQKQKENRPEGSCRQCLTRPAVPGLTSCQKCRERGCKKMNNLTRETRLKVLVLYGGKCQCPGCTVSNFKYLQLDHKNNDGGIERKALPPSIRGTKFFKLVLSQEKRNDLQLLCANCHNTKRYGGCTEEDHAGTRTNPLPENPASDVEPRSHV